MNKHGILIISHGSRDRQWVELVDLTIEAACKQFYEERSIALQITLEEVSRLYPIVSSFLELVNGRLIQDGIHTLQNKGVTHIDVLPLFVSAGSTHVEEIKQAFGFLPQDDFIGDLPKLVCNSKVTFDLPLIDDDELVHILSRQLRDFQLGLDNQQALLLLGHGSTHEQYYGRWEQGMVSLIGKLKLHYPKLPMHYAALLPDSSRTTLEALVAQYNQVVVLPLFISPGYFTTKVIPSRIEGLSYIYSGETLLPSTEMIGLLYRRFTSLLLV